MTEVATDVPTAIVFGAEQMGVSEFAIAQSDGLVHIPMFGFTESFNISVAVALLFQRLLLDQPDDDSWKLTVSEKAELREQWIRQSLGDKLDPLCRRFESDAS